MAGTKKKPTKLELFMLKVQSLTLAKPPESDADLFRKTWGHHRRLLGRARKGPGLTQGQWDKVAMYRGKMKRLGAAIGFSEVLVDEKSDPPTVRLNVGNDSWVVE